MRKSIALLFTIILASSIAEAASYKLRYYDGDNTAVIAPLKDERQCHQLAKQKRLKRNDYYCSTKSSPDYQLERDLGWR